MTSTPERFNAPDAEVRYLRIIIDLSSVWGFLQQSLGEYQIDLSVVIGELLKDIFEKPSGYYGKHGRGIEASIYAQAVVLSAKQKAEIEHYITEAQTRLLDELEPFVVDGNGSHIEYYYLYGGDQFVSYYRPVQAHEVTPEQFSLAIDKNAMRYLVSSPH